MKKVISFMKKHPAYHATLHGLGGIGVGILIAHPIAAFHPLYWAIALLALSLIGHVYAWFA